MTGNMIEAKTRHVDWSDVDVDTFTRLCEFAYLQDYTPPSPHLNNEQFLRSKKKGKKNIKRKKKKFSWDETEVPGEPEMDPAEPEMATIEADMEPPEPDPEPEAEIASDNDNEIPYKERSIWTEHLRDTFAEALIVPRLLHDELVYDFSPPRNNLPWQDFTPVFLGQARLYVIADKYGIEHLRRLVLSKLYQTLKSFKLYSNGLNGVLELVRYIYANTPPLYNDKLDALRNLVTRYVVSIIGQIGEHESFRDLLQEGDAFISDFWSILWSVQNGV